MPEIKGAHLGAIRNVLFENLPSGVTAKVSRDDPFLVNVTGDPIKLQAGTLDKKAVISCQFGGRPCRIDFGLKALVTE